MVMKGKPKKYSGRARISESGNSVQEIAEASNFGGRAKGFRKRIRYGPHFANQTVELDENERRGQKRTVLSAPSFKIEKVRRTNPNRLRPLTRRSNTRLLILILFCAIAERARFTFFISTPLTGRARCKNSLPSYFAAPPNVRDTRPLFYARKREVRGT